MELVIFYSAQEEWWAEQMPEMKACLKNDPGLTYEFLEVDNSQGHAQLMYMIKGLPEQKTVEKYMSKWLQK